jgi:hypothetical protein
MLTGMTPWYIKAASTFGVPAAIALYLIYYLTTSMPTKADMLLIGDQLRTHVSSTQTDLTEIRRVLVASCVNSAKNDAERDRCLGR